MKKIPQKNFHLPADNWAPLPSSYPQCDWHNCWWAVFYASGDTPPALPLHPPLPSPASRANSVPCRKTSSGPDCRLCTTRDSGECPWTPPVVAWSPLSCSFYPSTESPWRGRDTAAVHGPPPHGIPAQSPADTLGPAWNRQTRPRPERPPLWTAFYDRTLTTGRTFHGDIPGDSWGSLHVGTVDWYHFRNLFEWRDPAEALPPKIE